MEREKAKRVLVVGAIAVLAAAEAAQAVYTHGLAEQLKNSTVAPAITLSAEPVAMKISPWEQPFSYLRQVQTALDQEERAMAQAFSSWPAPMTAALPSGAPGGAVESVSLQSQPDQYVVRAKLPAGVEAKQVKVRLAGRQLRLSTQVSGRIRGHGDHAAQSYSDAYVESFTLPGPVVASSMKQQFQGGLLTITIPKAPVPKVSI